MGTTNFEHTISAAERLQHLKLEEAEKLSGWICLCQVCREPQRYTPSGMACKNGHGGAPAVNIPAISVPSQPKDPS